MKVLMTAGRFPFPPDSGGSLRVYHLLRLLAPKHDIRLIAAHPTMPTPEQLAHAAGLGVVVDVVRVPQRSVRERLHSVAASPVPDMALRLASRDFSAAVERALGAQRYDAIHIAGLEAAEPVRAALANLTALKPAVILDAFNAEYVLQRRAWEVDRQRPGRWPHALYSFIQWRKLLRYEAAVVGSSAAVLAMSDEDRAALAPLAGDTPIAVVPHGVDTAHYAPDPAQRAAPTALFIGTLDFRPNVDAAVWCAREVWPIVRSALPTARLLLVGRSPSPAVRTLDGDGVTVTGEVPDDLPYFQQAGVFVLPMRYGGGVRLKLLQALSAGLPVVTTPMGAEGVAVHDGREVLLAGDAPALAAAVVRVLRDPELSARLSVAGRALVRERYRWENTAQQVEEVWSATVAARPVTR